MSRRYPPAGDWRPPTSRVLLVAVWVALIMLSVAMLAAAGYLAGVLIAWLLERIP